MILNNKLKSLVKIKIKSSKIKKINKSKLFKKYEGEVKTDKPNGWGSMVLNDNSVIYGNFKNGKLNGFGICENKGKTSEIGFFKNSQLLGETAGHEMGHFIGLFHPSESAGTLFDPIADTPQCPLSQNSNNDSKLTAEECGQQYGADNLMFWDSWENGNQDNLTEGQVYVLKRALIAK